MGTPYQSSLAAHYLHKSFQDEEVTFCALSLSPIIASYQRVCLLVYLSPKTQMREEQGGNSNWKMPSTKVVHDAVDRSKITADNFHPLVLVRSSSLSEEGNDNWGWQTSHGFLTAPCNYGC